jgi:GGDEF domain-containing protein
MSNISRILSRLTDACWLFVPTLLFFSALYSVYFFNTEIVINGLANLWWMSYVSLAIAATIAWKFGRSRLVYACLLLLIIAFDNEIAFTSQWLEIRYSGVLFAFVFLLYSKDKGFSALNMLLSMTVLLILFVFSGLALPSLELLIQTWLSPVSTLLLEVSPDIHALITPFNTVLLVVALLLGLFRLFLKPDNSHNALYFALALSALLHIYHNAAFALITIVSLSGLFCYSVIKDSFIMAFKDELTGIPSRRALMQYVQTLGRKYTVVMSDIDHFKKFNDTYGHDVGDEVLKLVATKLNKVTGGGKAFRFGGEEFIIVFPRKTSAEVLPFVEVVRQTIADYDIALRAKPRPPKPKKPPTKKPRKDKLVKVTTSFGIAQRNKEHADFSSVMKQADIALYAAKKAGRNCVKTAKQAN